MEDSGVSPNASFEGTADVTARWDRSSDTTSSSLSSSFALFEAGAPFAPRLRADDDGVHCFPRR